MDTDDNIQQLIADAHKSIRYLERWGSVPAIIRDAAWLPLYASYWETAHYDLPKRLSLKELLRSAFGLTEAAFGYISRGDNGRKAMALAIRSLCDNSFLLPEPAEENPFT